MRAAVAEGPVSVAVEASSETFRFYHGGIIDTKCGSVPNQFVTIVGYDTQDGIDVWIVKNSYGKFWGIGGFAYISRDSLANKGSGICGILRIGGSMPASSN